MASGQTSTTYDPFRFEAIGAAIWSGALTRKEKSFTLPQNFHMFSLEVIVNCIRICSLQILQCLLSQAHHSWEFQ